MSSYHRLVVASVRRETRDAVVVEFEPPEPLRAAFHYTAGQHLNLRARIGGEELRRSYSICASAQEQRLRIAIKRQAGGRFSRWANEELRVGMEIEVMPPAGRFFTPLPPGLHHVLAVAAGSGITPVLSVIKTILAADAQRQVTLFYGNRSSATVLFREELAELKDRYLTRFSLVHVMSREHQDIGLLNGRITAEKFEAMLDLWCRPEETAAFYLCGPREMHASLSAVLRARGVPAERIRTEIFAAGAAGGADSKAPPPAGAEPARCLATLIVDGRRHEVAMTRGNETILDAALRHGVEARYSCKSGVCATCRAKVVQGEVEMDGGFALEDYEIARGFVLTCQSYPLSETLVVDFDQDS